MNTHFSDDHGTSDNKPISHSTRAIEAAHYLRQIVISKRRYPFSDDHPPRQIRPVAQTVNSWKL